MQVIDPHFQNSILDSLLNSFMTQHLPDWEEERENYIYIPFKDYEEFVLFIFTNMSVCREEGEIYKKIYWIAGFVSCP